MASQYFAHARIKFVLISSSAVLENAASMILSTDAIMQRTIKLCS